MKLIFCSNPLSPSEPDMDFELEVLEAQSLGIEYYLVNFEHILNKDPERALKKIHDLPVHELAIFRGWMLHEDQYHLLYNALFAKGLNLINDPHAYSHCHYLPESYSVIKGYTPETVWLELEKNHEIDIDQIMELLKPLGTSPLILKDYVKSRKHEWKEACFIPSAADKDAVERVTRRFIELQGEELNKGLIYRKFVDLEPLTNHSKSGMPLNKEFRLFYLDGEMIYWAKYWGEGNYENVKPPFEQFAEIAKKVKSRFFTMDIARQLNGEWIIVELGDAQVAGLPETTDVHLFYERIIKRLNQE